MAQSIESIWKEGFLQDKALVAPKVNDLYNQKSIHTIAKYKRMFRINIKAIVIGAILLVPLSWLVKMPYLGIMMSIMLAPLAYVNWQKLKELEQIKEQSTSYEYLLQMKQWIESKTASNIKMSRIIYPYIVLTMAVSFWMMDINGLRLGQLATDAFLEFFPNSILLAGIPLIGIVLPNWTN